MRVLGQVHWLADSDLEALVEAESNTAKTANVDLSVCDSVKSS
jgi:hypothetical protein